MSSIIRFPGETDQEYERRTRPLLAELGDIIRKWEGRELAKAFNPNPFREMLTGKIGRYTGFSDAGVFKWDI